ncbi:MAG: PHB depolymerase family esterase [Pseudomonadota bacterium]
MILDRSHRWHQSVRVWSLLALGALGVLAGGGCMESGDAVAAASAFDSRTLTVGKERRQYALYTPQRLPPAGERSLVLVFHGGEGSPDKIARQTGFNEVADAQGFLVAYPRSIEHWNDGRATTQSYGDDIGFARALIDALVADAGVDPRRVYATGASNGGMMTLRLACEANDAIAAFAPVIASFPVPYVERCRPERAVDILMINGRKDRLIRWGGGRIPKGRRAGVGGEVIPVAQTVDWWRTHNGCASPTRDDLADRVDDGTTVVRERNGACERGGSVIFFAIEGGGHTWPGSPVPANALAGRISQELSASQVIWQFFADKRL